MTAPPKWSQNIMIAPWWLAAGLVIPAVVVKEVK